MVGGEWLGAECGEIIEWKDLGRYHDTHACYFRVYMNPVVVYIFLFFAYMLVNVSPKVQSAEYDVGWAVLRFWFTMVIFIHAVEVWV